MQIVHRSSNIQILVCVYDVFFGNESLDLISVGHETIVYCLDGHSSVEDQHNRHLFYQRHCLVKDVEHHNS